MPICHKFIISIAKLGCALSAQSVRMQSRLKNGKPATLTVRHP